MICRPVAGRPSPVPTGCSDNFFASPVGRSWVIQSFTASFCYPLQTHTSHFSNHPSACKTKQRQKSADIDVLFWWEWEIFEVIILKYCTWYWSNIFIYYVYTYINICIYCLDTMRKILKICTGWCIGASLIRGGWFWKSSQQFEKGMCCRPVAGRPSPVPTGCSDNFFASPVGRSWAIRSNFIFSSFSCWYSCSMSFKMVIVKLQYFSVSLLPLSPLPPPWAASASVPCRTSWHESTLIDTNRH